MNQAPMDSVPEDPIQREIHKLDEINEKQENRVRNLEIKAIQVVNLYFVFQGVILTSTSMASSLKCHNWWIPFTLSLLAAILNLFTFFNTMSTVLKSREELDQNLADLAFMRLYKVTRAQLNQVFPGSPLNQPEPQPQPQPQVDHQGGREIVRPKPDSAQRWKRQVLAYVSIGLFIGFSSVIMYGCYTILCHPNDPDKCLKIC